MAAARTSLKDAVSRAPLAGSYPAAVAIALLALCPFIALTTAFALFEQNVVQYLGASRFGTQLTEGLSNAAYAFGAVVSADLIQRLPGRRLYLGCELGFIAGSLLGVFAPDLAAFAIARVLQGLSTGMLLVAALPPLVTKHGADKLPSTAAFVNLGLFGMVTLGPVIGGVAADFAAWRLVFAAVAALAAVGFVCGLVAFEPNDPPNPGAGFDPTGIPLAVAATVLPFFGVSWLTKGGFASAGFIAPVVVGVAALVALVVVQYRKRDALMPVRPISHTLPIVGTAGAMAVGAAFTTLLELVEVFLLDVVRDGPAIVGALVASQLGGIALAAWLFRRVLATRWTPHLALSGVVTVAAAGAILLALGRGSVEVVVPVAAFLLGYGAGAGVAPGLFMPGFSVESTKIGPTFALVELLRSEAAFLIGPVLLAIAMSAGALSGGLHLAIGITLAFMVVSGLTLVTVYLLGGARPHSPDLDGWLGGETTGYHSPPFAARLRRAE